VSSKAAGRGGLRGEAAQGGEKRCQLDQARGADAQAGRQSGQIVLNKVDAFLLEGTGGLIEIFDQAKKRGVLITRGDHGQGINRRRRIDDAF